MLLLDNVLVHDDGDAFHFLFQWNHKILIHGNQYKIKMNVNYLDKTNKNLLNLHIWPNSMTLTKHTLIGRRGWWASSYHSFFHRVTHFPRQSLTFFPRVCANTEIQFGSVRNSRQVLAHLVSIQFLYGSHLTIQHHL